MKCALVVPVIVLALSASIPAQTVASPSPDAAFAQGTRAMNEQRWPDAVHDFDQVIQSHGARIDAALYWKAYCFHQLSRHNDARTTCDVLHAKFPASSWNSDCAALSLDQRSSSQAKAVPEASTPGAGKLRASTSANDDLKLLALNSLAQQDPARAMPIFREMLTGDQPEQVKEHVIFALTQSGTPEAAALLNEVITGKLGVELQTRAIPEIGALSGPRWSEVFTEVYRTTSDPAVKHAVISALFVSGDATRLVALARSETDIHLRQAIVGELALMNNKVAEEYMLELLK